MKKIYIGLFVIGVLVTVFLTTKDKVVPTVVEKGYLNATYKIEGKEVRLVNGKSEEPILGSSSKVVTQYFGNEVESDLNLDGRKDIVFLLTQQTGGSGTFYYVVASLNKEGGFIGSLGVLLGDRIAPQSTEVKENNIVVVNYADRKLGESFAVQPSVGKSIWLKLDETTMQFGEVAQNFEGEADPNRMTLFMKGWVWINTNYDNNVNIKPTGTKQFILTFNSDKTFSATTDCNNVGGEYSVSGNKISFSKMMSTLMFCENSKEGDFVKMLGEIQNYTFTSKGELVFGLKPSGGSMVFK
jgi:hypothetical protein